jgi:hypothetical protein
VFYRHLPSKLYRFDIISTFVIAENSSKTISAARGRARPEVKSPYFVDIVTLSISLSGRSFSIERDKQPKTRCVLNLQFIRDDKRTSKH